MIETHDVTQIWIYRDADWKLGSDLLPLEALHVGTDYPTTGKCSLLCTIMHQIVHVRCGKWNIFIIPTLLSAANEFKVARPGCSVYKPSLNTNIIVKCFKLDVSMATWWRHSCSDGKSQNLVWNKLRVSGRRPASHTKFFRGSHREFHNAVIWLQ